MDRVKALPQLVDQVYTAILDAICIGELPPNERITQDSLAERLSVSRQPVLQALLLLKRQGFVADTGRRGLVVAPLDSLSVAHLYEVRGTLDALAARGAASRRNTDANVRGTALIEIGRAAAKSRDVTGLINADLAFHSFIYELSGNPLIAEAVALHWQHIRRVMGAVLRADRPFDHVWDEHSAILAAIVAGDPARAEKLAKAHASDAAHLLAKELALLSPAPDVTERQAARV